MEMDFPKRVATGILNCLLCISQNMSSIRQFYLSLIGTLSKMRKTNNYDLYKYDSMLELFIENGLKIPNSMKNAVDENTIRYLMKYLSNVNCDEQYNEVINNLELLIKEYSKESNLELRDDLYELKKGLMGDMYDSTIYYGCTDAGKTLDYIASNKNVTLLCQGNDLEKLKVLELKAELLNLKEPIFENGSTILNSSFVGKNKFDFAIIEWRNDLIPSKDEYEEIKRKVNMQKDIFIFGEATQASSAFVAMQQVLYSLSEKGKALFIVPSGLLFKGGKDKEVREQLIRRDIVETIITLPPKLAGRVGISFSIIIFNKAKKNINKIQLINAQDIGTSTSKNQIELTAEEIEKIINTYNTKDNIEHFSKNVDLWQFDENDYNLHIERYVPLEEETIKTNYFSDVEVNTKEIEKILDAKDWIPLEYIAKIYKGANILKTNDDKNGKYKVLNMSGLKDGEIDYSDIIRSDMKKFRVFPIIEKNDILISCKGEAIKIAIVDQDVEDFTVTQSTMVIRVAENGFGKISPKYLEIYLSSPMGRYLITRIQKGTYIHMISLSDLSTIPVIIRPFNEQEELIKEYEEQKKNLENEMEIIINKMKENRKKLYEKIGIGETYSFNKK